MGLDILRETRRCSVTVLRLWQNSYRIRVPNNNPCGNESVVAVVSVYEFLQLLLRR